MWSLAVVLFMAATGRRPFPRSANVRRHDDLHVRCPQLVGEPPPAPPELPATAGELVRPALERDRRQRPTAAEMPDALASLQASEPRRRGDGRRRR